MSVSLTENRIYPDDRAPIVVTDNADFGNTQVAIADAIEHQLFANSSGVARATKLFDMVRGGLAIERFLFDFGDRKLRITLRTEPGASGRIEEFMATPES